MVTNTKSSRAKKKVRGTKSFNSKKEKLSQLEELFCQYFVNNDELRGNATKCYAEAYNYKLDELSHDDAIWEYEDGERTKLIEESSYAKSINVCAVNGNRLLRRAKVQTRLTILRVALLNDDVVDSKLAETIVQNDSYHARMMGIAEYNKLKQRITDKIDLTSKGEPIKSITYAGPQP